MLKSVPWDVKSIPQDNKKVTQEWLPDHKKGCLSPIFDFNESTKVHSVIIWGPNVKIVHITLTKTELMILTK